MAGKTGDVVKEGVSETSGRDIELRFQEFLAACLAEFFLRGVLAVKAQSCYAGIRARKYSVASADSPC